MQIEIRKRTTTNRKAFNKTARVYIWPNEKETVVEQMVNRRCRPHQQWRRDVMPKVIQELKLPFDTKYRWSQFAGCSCPCSPGFILDRCVDASDIHVHL